MLKKFFSVLVLFSLMITIVMFYSISKLKPHAGEEVIERPTPQKIENNTSDLIRVSVPQPNTIISSPLRVAGEARGTWFFEADFPIALYDENGVLIAEGIGRAQENWMTEEFVPFEGKVIFSLPEGSKATLVLHKSNPSGLAENDDSLLIPVVVR